MKTSAATGLTRTGEMKNDAFIPARGESDQSRAISLP